MQMVICKIKDWLKPLVSFLILGRNRRWWVGDSWNRQALRDIGKYQVQIGLDTGSPLIVSNFAFGMMFSKETQRKINTSTSNGTIFWQSGKSPTTKRRFVLEWLLNL